LLSIKLALGSGLPVSSKCPFVLDISKLETFDAEYRDKVLNTISEQFAGDSRRSLDEVVSILGKTIAIEPAVWLKLLENSISSDIRPQLLASLGLKEGDIKSFQFNKVSNELLQHLPTSNAEMLRTVGIMQQSAAEVHPQELTTRLKMLGMRLAGLDPSTLTGITQAVSAEVREALVSGAISENLSKAPSAEWEKILSDYKSLGELGEKVFSDAIEDALNKSLLSNPTRIIDFIQSGTGYRLENNTLNSLLLAASSAYPQESFDAALKFSPSSASPILQKWQQNDPWSMSEYVVCLSASPQKDLASSIIAVSEAHNDRDAAVIWANAITDPDLRLETLRKIGAQ
jgi:hypothetical protein